MNRSGLANPLNKIFLTSTGVSFDNINNISPITPIQHLYSAEMTDRSSTPTSPEAENVEVPEITGGTELIDLVNFLQTKCTASGHKIDVSLPQVVAIGAQSAGKSSVLESIVGREFLPRGTGVVTRRPIIVQLNPTSNAEFAKFDHTGDKVFTDFNEVRKEIVEETDRSLAPGAFSTTPIILQIFSSNVLKLTVVDLPGIVKCAIDGQDALYVNLVRDMILEYISKPECIVLAVSPANQDIATSDALQMAQEVDPQRERTIGVLSKLDLMDRGTNALDVLENRKLFLKKGYVGVVNRCQKDILEGRDMPYILRREKEFFQNHPSYSHLAPRMGIPYLQKLLQKTLRTHIKASLPNVRNDLALRLLNVERSLKLLEQNIGPKRSSFFAIKLVQNFIEDITVSLMGNSELVNMSRVSAGARIHYLLHTEIQNNLNLDLMPDRKELTIAVVNLTAMRTCISIPSLTIESICRTLVSNYKRPLESSVNCIMNVLESAVMESATLMNEYPSLKNEVIYRVRCCINRESESTQERLSSHVDAEMFTVNMCHPDFNASSCERLAPSASVVKIWETSDQNSLVSTASSNDSSRNSNTSLTTISSFEPQRPERKSSRVSISNGDIPYKLSPQVTSTMGSPASPPESYEFGQILNSEEIETLLMENNAIQRKVSFVSAMITEYLKVVKKSMGDVSVKYISYFLVEKVLQFIKHDLVTSLLDSAKLEKLMEDGEDDFLRKAEMEAQRNCIREALDAIQAF